MKQKILCYLPCVLGVLLLIELMKLILTNDQRLFLNNYNNPFIKYSLLIFASNLGISLSLTPLFMKYGLITMDYYQSDKYVKARTTFNLISFNLPGLLFFFIALYYRTTGIGIWILGGLVLFMYSSSFMNIIRNRRKR